MGAITRLIQDIDPSSHEYNDQKELIEVLAQLAQAKADGFALQIEKSIAEADMDLIKSLPVESWIKTAKETHAIPADGAQDLVKRITDGITQFVEGTSGTKDDSPINIISSVGSMLGTAVDAFLSAGSSSGEKLERTVVYLNGLGVERLDFKVWKREISGSGIKTKVSKVTAFVAVRSAVDLTKVKANTFLILYGKQLRAMNYDDDDFERAIDAAKRMLSKFEMGANAGVNQIDMQKASALLTGE